MPAHITHVEGRLKSEPALERTAAIVVLNAEGIKGCYVTIISSYDQFHCMITAAVGRKSGGGRCGRLTTYNIECYTACVVSQNLYMHSCSYAAACWHTVNFSLWGQQQALEALWVV